MLANIYAVTIFLLILMFGRVLYILLMISYRRTHFRPRKRVLPVKLAVVMGSGGHTAEMLRLMEKLNFMNYNPRLYIIASSDETSEAKVLSLERSMSSTGEKGSYAIHKIPRSRRVNQSYLTSIFSTLNSIMFSVPLVFCERPELVICNGPGTCIPICIIAFIMKALWICDTKIIYVESVCRVKTLSLSGKILLYFADEIFVQWENLHKMYSSTKYMGRLV